MPRSIETEQGDGSETTSPADLGFPKNDPSTRTADGVPRPREIEVEALEPRPADINSGMVEIRMAETIEEFTFGNPHRSYRLEANRRYRLPVDVARYLYKLGYTYQVN